MDNDIDALENHVLELLGLTEADLPSLQEPARARASVEPLFEALGQIEVMIRVLQNVPLN